MELREGRLEVLECGVAVGRYGQAAMVVKHGNLLIQWVGLERVLS
jgi:hypothetical protein